eukprot:2926470-Rhodomonas_salina.2
MSATKIGSARYEDEGGYEIDRQNIRPPAPPPHLQPPPALPHQVPPPHMFHSPVLAPGHNPNLPPGWPIPIGQQVASRRCSRCAVLSTLFSSSDARSSLLSQADAPPRPTGGSTSLADLERQLLSSASLLSLIHI